MSRSFGYSLLVACLAGVVAGAQQSVFRGATELVRVYTTVTDKDGRIITNLTRSDFEVRDDGKPQPITLFDNTPRPIRLVVMLDVSGSMRGSLSLMRQGADQLFQRLLKDDLVRVGEFGHTVIISTKFTRNLDDLRAALPGTIELDALTPLWRAVDKAMDTFTETDNERRVVLVMSDGGDSGPTLFRFRPISGKEVIDRARIDDVMIYAIGLRSTGNPTVAPPDPGLLTVALETGGGYSEVNLGQDLGKAFARVAEELHSQYLLGFDPPKRDGKTHKIDVRVLQKDMTARARKNYVAPKE